MKLDPDSRREQCQLKEIQRMTKDKRLFGMWRRSPYIEVRAAAIYKIQNQAMLGHVALNESMAQLRCEAVRKLKDKAILMRISKEDTSEIVRYIAHKKLTYQGRKPWSMSEEMNDDVAQVIAMMLEYDASIKNMATGEENEEWW